MAGSDFFQLNRAALRYMGKSILDFFLDDHMAFAQKRGIAGGKVVLPVGLGYEIQYREAVFLRERRRPRPSC